MGVTNPFPNKAYSSIEHANHPPVKLQDTEMTSMSVISSLDVAVAFPESVQSSSVNSSMDMPSSNVAGQMIFSDPTDVVSGAGCKFVLMLEGQEGHDNVEAHTVSENNTHLDALWDAICPSCKQDPCVIFEVAIHFSAIASNMSDAGKQNNEIRHQLYHEATKHIHGHLGKGNCQPLPSCVADSICNALPSSNGTEYTGYKKAHTNSLSNY